MAARIGIVGPSCSGKSTVARIVAKRLGARLLGLDDYYLRGHARRHVDVGGESVRSFEHPLAYDGAALLRDMDAEKGPVVAEGFLLFAYPGIVEALDHKIFVDLSWDEIRRRRDSRKGQNAAAVERSFALIGESEWLLFGIPQKGLDGISVLDGMETPEKIAGKVADIAGRTA